MSGRAWVLLLLAVAALGWWRSPLSPRLPNLAAPIADEPAGCRLPPLVTPGDEPRQTPVPAALAPIRLQVATLQPLAGFSVDARVLSREDYSSGREAQLSPTDLALGWGRMRDDTVLAHLEISQSGRWYYYRWRNDPPLPPQEIARSSANMHMIPSDAGVARALKSVRTGDRVRVDGWLIQAESPDGWRWRSSTSRDDSGAGGCEVIYVCAITPLAAIAARP